MIPGLGSSPVGAYYRYRDADVVEGTTYFYELEDIETTGRRNRHGPVSASPGTTSPGAEPPEPGSEEGGVPVTTITYGDPEANSFRVVERGTSHVVLELSTLGFYAEPQEDGTVRLRIPGFVEETEAGEPAIPVKRTWIEAVSRRGVQVSSVRSFDVEPVEGFRPSLAPGSEVVVGSDGTIHARRKPRRRRREVSRAGLFPSEQARALGIGFQEGTRKVQIGLAPLRWDGKRQELVLDRRLVVRLEFRGRDAGPTVRRRRKRSGSMPVVELAVESRGIYAVRFEEVFGSGWRALAVTALGLSRLGEPVPYHVEPDPRRFGPGSTLYFFSEGAALNPYGTEAIYRLELGTGGTVMEVRDATPTAAPATESFYWEQRTAEENRYYQAALVDAPDLWQWEVIPARETKSFGFDVDSLVEGVGASQLEVRFQGASDFVAAPDHHVRLYVNGSYVAEASWNGKQPRTVEAELSPGVLTNGENRLEIENVGDTEAPYSMVMLNRFSIRYPRRPVAVSGHLEGEWSVAGVAEVTGAGSDTVVVDLSENSPRWLTGIQRGAALRFTTESAHSYVVADGAGLRRAEVRKVRTPKLLGKRRAVDYLVIGPRAFLDEATDLLEHRRAQGLRVAAVATEDIYSELGFGEARPEALRELIAHAYHVWARPEAPLRYVLLLGDGTYDFKNYYQLGAANHVPPLMIKTRYLWTASDPMLAAVNGDDPLPDVAIGRLPASSAAEVRTVVAKILAYETAAGAPDNPIVLVTDNPDRAGDFVRDAREIAAEFLLGRDVRFLHLSERGTPATRASILSAFDEGASLMSYLGHGGIHLWASENLLDTGAVNSLSPQSHQPIVITMNCLNGYLHFPFFDSLSEALVEADGKGAIAAFSPTGLSLNGPAHLYHRALMGALLDPRHERLGDAVNAAQEAYAETGAFPELLQIYHLIGDPALKLH